MALYPDHVQGWLARMDPRASLVCCFLLSCEIATLTRLAPVLASLAFAFLLLLMARLPLVFVLKRMAAANFFILFIWLATPWTTAGEPVWQWGPLVITRQGVELALLVTIKANALVLLFTTLLAPIPVTILGGALARLGLSDKLAWMIILMGRNVEVLKSEWRKITIAASLRGFRAGANLRSYRIIATFVALLFVRASERGERMHEAMLLRGFNGKVPVFARTAFSGYDIFFGCACLLCGLLIIWLEWGCSQ